MLTQFWDTSAFVSLFYREPFTDRALAARDMAERWYAWDWLVLESWSAFARRGSSERQRRARRQLLRRFGYLTLDAEHHPAIQRQITRHRLRSADAGHLLCLKQVRQLHRDVVFVCCDAELIAAARAERIPVWQ
jgi:predicted nucleic acid-binding protein